MKHAILKALLLLGSLFLAHGTATYCPAGVVDNFQYPCSATLPLTSTTSGSGGSLSTLVAAATNRATFYATVKIGTTCSGITLSDISHLFTVQRYDTSTPSSSIAIVDFAHTPGPNSGTGGTVVMKSGTVTPTASNSLTAPMSTQYMVADSVYQMTAAVDLTSLSNGLQGTISTPNPAAGTCGVPASITYSQSFTNLAIYSASSPQCTSWTAFLSQLLGSYTYTRLTIRGTYDSTGVSTTDSSLILAIANALRTGGTYGPITSGGGDWQVGMVGSGNGICALGGVGSCANPGYVVRPCIGNENWGGANTAVCNPPTQTITVEFQIVTSSDCGTPSNQGGVAKTTSGLPIALSSGGTFDSNTKIYFCAASAIASSTPPLFVQCTVSLRIQTGSAVAPIEAFWLNLASSTQSSTTSIKSAYYNITEKYGVTLYNSATTSSTIGSATLGDGSTSSTKPTLTSNDAGLTLSSLQYVSIPVGQLNADLHGFTSVSVSFWIKVTSLPSSSQTIFKITDSAGTTNRVLLSLETSGNIKGRINSLTAVANTPSSSVISTSSWCFVTAYLGGSSTRSIVHITISTSPSSYSSTPVLGAATISTASSDKGYIGSQTSDGLAGKIADFRIKTPGSLIFNYPSCDNSQSACAASIGVTPGAECIAKNAYCPPETTGSSSSSCTFSPSYVCPTECATCGPAACTSCTSSYVLESGACVATCPTGKYNNNGVCTSCTNTDCATCSNNLCASCKSGITNDKFEVNTCVAACSSGKYNNNRVCTTCTNTDCATCPNNVCASCKTGITNDKFDGSTCVSACPSGKYNNNGVCTTCTNTDCATCPGNACASCKSGITNDKFDVNTCVAACPIGKYNSNGVCTTCANTDCATCPGNSCASCKTGITNDKFDVNTCVAACPTGKYNNNGVCTTCTNTDCATCPGNACTSCKTGITNDKFDVNTCVANCPSGKYNNNGVCTTCTNTDCVTCPNDACASCKSGITNDKFDVNTCLANCPIGKYNNNRVCTICTNTDCATCPGNACASCKSGITNDKFDINTCVATCPSGKYNSNGVCTTCTNTDCATCPNDVCALCKSGITNDKFDAGTCISTCPVGKYDNNGFCIACTNSDCATCPNNACASCKSGITNNKFDGTTCVATCPSGTYNNNGVCTNPQIVISDDSSALTRLPSQATFVTATYTPSFYQPQGNLPFTMNWRQVSGPPINDTPTADTTNPFILKIAKCALEGESLFEFMIALTLKDQTTPYSTAISRITTKLPQIGVRILNQSSTQTIGSDIILNTEFFATDPCNVLSHTDVFDETTATFMWDCHKVLPGTTTKVACPDSSSLFSQNVTSPRLTILSSYFTSPDEGAEIIIDFTANVLRRLNSTFITLNTQTSFSIVLLQAPKGQITSSNEASSILLSAQMTNPSPSWTYSWELTPNTNPYFITQNKMKMLGPYNNDVRVKLTITTETGLRSDLFYRVPKNDPPSAGILRSEPSTGLSLDTMFNIDTYGWVETDLPMTYQFYYSFKIIGGFISLSSEQLDPFIKTQLQSGPDSTSVYIKTIVKDSFGAASDDLIIPVTVTSSVSNFVQAIAQANSVSKASEIKDPLTKLRISSLLISGVASWEATSQTSSPCPTCSGHGTCDSSGQCKCNAGYKSFDCSLTETDLTNIVEAKISLLNNIESAFLQADEHSIRNMLFGSMQSLAQTQEPDQHEIFTKMQNITKTTLDIDNASTILCLDERGYLSNVLDSTLGYFNNTLKEDQGKYNDNLENTTLSYLEAVTRSNLHEKFPGEPPAVDVVQAYDIYNERVTLCNLTKSRISTSTDAPNIHFELSGASLSEEECQTQIDIEYYVFRNDMYLLNQPDTQNDKILATESEKAPKSKVVGKKTHIALNLKNSLTGKKFTNVVTKVNMPGTMACPSGCYKAISSSTTNCVCKEIGAFDVKSQVTKIFQKSNIAKVSNISALAHFQFWKNIPFWAVAVFTAWFLISLWYIKFRAPALDILASKSGKSTGSRAKRIGLLLMVTHPLLSIYFHNEPTITKSTKLILFYTRMILLLTYSVIFSDVGNGEGLIFQVYLILFYFVTVIPIYSILFHLVSAYRLKKNTVKSMTNEDELDSNYSIKQIIGIILTSIILLGCLLVILILIAQQTFDEQSKLTINFAIMLFQDLIATPTKKMGMQVFALVAMGSGLAARYSFPVLIMSKVVGDKFKGVFLTLFPPVQRKQKVKQISTETSPFSVQSMALKTSSDSPLIAMQHISDLPMRQRTIIKIQRRFAERSNVDLDHITVEDTNLKTKAMEDPQDLNLLSFKTSPTCADMSPDGESPQRQRVRRNVIS